MTVPAFFGAPGLWGVMGGSSNKAAYLQVPGGLLATPAGAALCWVSGVLVPSGWTGPWGRSFQLPDPLELVGWHVRPVPQFPQGLKEVRWGHLLPLPAPVPSGWAGLTPFQEGCLLLPFPPSAPAQAFIMHHFVLGSEYTVSKVFWGPETRWWPEAIAGWPSWSVSW